MLHAQGGAQPDFFVRMERGVRGDAGWGGGPFFMYRWRGLAIPYGGLNVFWRGKCCGGAWLEDPRQLWRTAGPLRIWTYRLF